MGQLTWEPEYQQMVAEVLSIYLYIYISQVLSTIKPFQQPCGQPPFIIDPILKEIRGASVLIPSSLPFQPQDVSKRFCYTTAQKEATNHTHKMKSDT